MVDRFKQGLFRKYFEIPQPIKVHRMLIYNLLKRQIILPNSENEDEIWFGLGQKEARFGKEEFCLCSGLNMGTLPEGFGEKEEVRKEPILTQHFADECPTIELFEAIFNWLTKPISGDDALKMGYLLMVSQFFGIDEARTAIPGWLFSLIEDIDAFERFSWGSYIFNVTLFWLKNAVGKHLGRLRGDSQKKEEKEENKKRKKKEEKKENEEEKKKKKKKKKKTEVEDGEDVEEETNNDNQQNNDVVKYFTFHSYGFLLAFQVWVIERITSLEGKISIRKGIGFPRFKNWNFNTWVLKVESNFSTTSKSKTSVPYTIPELYTSIKQLVEEQIKESEERMKSWLREEIGKIAKENKVGDTSTPKQSRESEEKDLDRDDNNRLDEMGQFVNEIHDGFSKKDQTNKQETKNVVGEEAGLDKVESWVHADTGCLDKEDTENVVGEACGSAKQAINLDDFPSPSVNMILPNPNLSVIFMEAVDPNMCYKNNDMKRARHRSRYLSTPYTDPMPIPKKKKKTQDSVEVVNENYNRFMSYLKKKDNTR
ncbi:hypothetical protein Dsin_005528 [Dipteronia sinensis]|uniref:DUF1985 domain-containing protein n=1 Tax=Dipteronia sinensis TaxID=43782 RepID=A0AAE0EES9_9ROSI|nr:hypothetical protein Dsin_005528 [Dipteronia sinensis]